MRKKVLTVTFAVFLMMGILAGCGKGENIAASSSTVSQEAVKTDATSESEAVSAKACSLCEVEKECGSYEVDGQTYVVCDDCYNEFATAFGIPRECSLCEVEKLCYGYIVEDETYIVCDDCYLEFATAFELKQPCGHCEQEKICGHYTVDDVTYVVCGDCYDEFAEGFGLK